MLITIRKFHKLYHARLGGEKWGLEGRSDAKDTKDVCA